MPTSLSSSITQASILPCGVVAVEGYFARRDWTPFQFQLDSWHAYLRGESGLIHAPTGTGKTLAAWMGPLAEAIGERVDVPAVGSHPGPSLHATPIETAVRGGPKPTRRTIRPQGDPFRVLWLTPLRALATDSAHSLTEPITDLRLPWTVELRTADTPSSLKLKQREQLPTVLVTTPESLSVLLSYLGARQRFATLRCVIVDEWHELISSKRGVQVELALARLRTWCPGLRTWGMSATLGNLEEAMHALVGRERRDMPNRPPPRLIQSNLAKRVEMQTLIPDDPERFTWAGHLGLRLAPKVLDAVEHSAAQSTLLFTNTRSQAEIWFKRFLDERPELLGHVAIHHGSLDRDLRVRVEGMLEEGRLRCVVCTSSLDLGIDFRPVDQVIQLGSPKGIARLLQRAGRSGHRPGAVSRVLGVPTNAFELVEFAALREKIEEANDRGSASTIVESRHPLDRPIDVLVQHLVTCAIGDGFIEDQLKAEVLSTASFHRLSDEEWNWAIDFVRRGGEALRAYPEYAKIALAPDPETGEARYVGVSDRIAKMHRLTIGTITSSAMMSVKYTTGQFIGTIEETFIARLEVGARFILAGRVLELVRVREMTAWVRRAPTKSGAIPRWDGGRMSLSTHLAAAVRVKLDEARQGQFNGPEMLAAAPLLRLQQAWSALPAPNQVLAEHITPPSAFAGPVERQPPPGSGGHHAFLYLFEGRLVHEGLGVLLSHRLSRRRPITITATATDQGFSLASLDPLNLDEPRWRELLTLDNLLEDLLECANASALARRQFRDIARVAGLIIPGFPGARKPARQLQASTEMFFEVLSEFDPTNLLLTQAQREVLTAQLDFERLHAVLTRVASSEILIKSTDRLTPLAFPIWAETLRSTQVSTEKWSDLVQKMSLRLDTEAIADTPVQASPVPTASSRLSPRKDRRRASR